MLWITIVFSFSFCNLFVEVSTCDETHFKTVASTSVWLRGSEITGIEKKVGRWRDIYLPMTELSNDSKLKQALPVVETMQLPIHFF